jgi:hypothetical protein
VNISLDVKESAPVSISLVNSLGQVVYSHEQNLTSGHTIHTIDTENLPAGYYFSVIENNSDRITEKLVVR